MAQAACLIHTAHLTMKTAVRSVYRTVHVSGLRVMLLCMIVQDGTVHMMLCTSYHCAHDVWYCADDATVHIMLLYT